jgi:hypothetical protein
MSRQFFDRIYTQQRCMVGKTRRCASVFSLILPLSYWALVSYGVKPTNAQDAPVSIEPRGGSGVGARGSADRVATNIRVNSDLVLIPVMVTDRHDHPITGLEKARFKLYEDKVEQVIAHFASEVGESRGRVCAYPVQRQRSSGGRF